MIAMFLFFGAATIGLFAYYSHRVGSLVNATTILTGMKVTVEFILEPVTYLLHLYDYDFRSIFLINLLSLCGYATFILGALIYKPVVKQTKIAVRSNSLILAWVLLAVAWALYTPVIIEFSDIISDPRRIYELTRTGYGVYTFGSALFSFLAFIVFLTSSKRGYIVFSIVLLLLVFLKGSKGQFTVLVTIFIIARMYWDRHLYSVSRSIIYSIIAAVFAVFIFSVNYRGEVTNIVITAASFSDYNRNGALVLQDDTSGYYGGTLSQEMLWIPKIPRVLWPEKPKVFGEFRLAAQYYPSWFEQDQGAPSFGLGIYFADFGWWAFLVYPLIQFMAGYLLSLCLGKITQTRSLFYFILAVYLAGANLLASGSGSFLVEHAIIGLFLAGLVRTLDILSAGFQKGFAGPWAVHER